MNISKNQEELLLWHSIFGHFSIRNVQNLVVEGGIKPKNLGVATCKIPLCRSYIAAKGKWVGLNIFKHTTNKLRHDVMRYRDIQPGDSVITDQYEYRIKGKLSYIKGKEDPQNIYSGGTLFIDHAT